VRDQRGRLSTLTFAAPAGATVLFDIRLAHRGTANRSPRHRDVLYLSVAQRWFADRVNFNERQTGAWHALDPGLQSLLRRVDHEQYVHDLEAEVAHLLCGGSQAAV